MIDELPSYLGFAKEYRHVRVENAKEYVAGKEIHVSASESFFVLLKNVVHGTFHHISKDQMDWYCWKFALEYNGREMVDTDLFIDTLTDTEGRRRCYFKESQA